MIVSELHYLTERQAALLLQKVGKRRKYRLLTLLMMDAGLRVSEAVSLQFKHLRFREKLIRVRSLKKRHETYRDVPISSRLLESLAAYLNEYKGDKSEMDSYLFPSGAGHLKRIAVWRFYNRIARKYPQLGHLHPHALRHTFATRLVNSDVSLVTARELLGHNSVQTTEIYTHVSAQELRGSIAAIEGRGSLMRNFWKRIFVRKRTQVIRLKRSSSILVGREKELALLGELCEKNVNVLLKGEQGTGKSQLLDNIKIRNRKIARIDELKSVKTCLVNLCMHVLQDKEELKNMLYNDTDVEVKLSKDSIKNLVDLLKKITRKEEYSVLIDEVTEITPSGVRVLEQMRDHFHIVAAARQVKIDKAGFLTNFQVLKIGNLKRGEALELIHRLSFDVMNAIEDYDFYRNHIVEQSEGNPQYIYEIVERYRKEEYISNDLVRKVRHTAANKEIDFTPFLVIALGSLMVLRFFGREVGESGYQLIGGIALFVALFARHFLRVFRRKFI